MLQLLRVICRCRGCIHTGHSYSQKAENGATILTLSN
jgi:hypothetical protein